MENKEGIISVLLTVSLVVLAFAIIIAGYQSGEHNAIPVFLNSTAESEDISHTGNVAGASDGRLATLQKGVNFFQWYVKQQKGASEQFRSAISDTDLQVISSMGFKHIRLQIKLLDIYNLGSPGSPNPALLALIDDTIQRFNAHGLAAVITLEVDGTRQTPGFLRNGYKQLWSGLAKHFSATDPKMVFLEVMNEPVFESDPSQWAPIQDQLTQTIRAGAPLHTILATGPQWSGVDGLSYIKPSGTDNNIVYVFHFYEHMTFTHQGADWSEDSFQFLKDVPYPVTSEGLQRALNETHDATAKKWIRDYCSEGWNRDVIDARIRQAINWSRENGVPIIADEFGCIDNAPYADRLQWFADVGWTLWTFDDYMGLDRKTGPDGNITLNNDLAGVLGLDISILKNGHGS
jgi:hypothetical protein